MTQEEIIKSAFMRGAETQKTIQALPVPEGTNPSAMFKLVVFMPIIAFIFLPIVALEATDGNWVYFLLSLIPGLAGLFFTIYSIGRKIQKQNAAIEERNTAQFEHAQSLAVSELTAS